MKVGLWLQDYSVSTKKRFDEVMDTVKTSDIDILVFPECSYTPFSKTINESDVFSDESANYFEEASKLAREVGKSIVFSDHDKYGTIFSWYYNPSPAEGETQEKFYVKHTATDFSAFDFENYRGQLYTDCFTPIILKGKTIGLTICYDCNHPVFSRLYGINGIDILINSTGGNVVYEKWYRYNQVRSIENNCFCFVTMGYDGDGKKIDSYVFGFDPSGQAITYSNLMKKDVSITNQVDSVYVYDTESYGVLTKANQKYSTYNKNEDFRIESGKVSEYFEKSKKLEEGLYVYPYRGLEIVFCVLRKSDILQPEKVLPLLYNSKLGGYNNKRYIIVNQWGDLTKEYYENTLQPVLRVRSMENFCAVVLESNIGNHCFQCGKNRTSQEVCMKDNRFGIDTSRTGGPESIWKNKPGMMKASWRENYEWMINNMSKKR